MSPSSRQTVTIPQPEPHNQIPPPGWQLAGRRRKRTASAQRQLPTQHIARLSASNAAAHDPNVKKSRRQFSPNRRDKMRKRAKEHRDRQKEACAELNVKLNEEHEIHGTLTDYVQKLKDKIGQLDSIIGGTGIKAEVQN